MKKIKWNTIQWSGPGTIDRVIAKIGCLTPECFPDIPTTPDNSTWFYSVAFGKSSRDYRTAYTFRVGQKTCKSLSKCQENVINYAKDLIEEYDVVVTAIKNGLSQGIE